MSTLKPVWATYDVKAEAWRLQQIYRYEWRDHVLYVLPGFQWDLSSVPRVLWAVIGSHELGLVASLFHDAFYRYGGVPHGYLMCEPKGRTFTRKEADKLFLRLMKEDGVSWWRRTAAYIAVRGFGWVKAWKDPADNPFLTNQGA